MVIGEVNIQTLLDEFVDEQAQLFRNDVSEQAISHLLAMKFASYFPVWDIDCEYSRKMEVVKRLIYAVSPTGEARERNVVPDIIIHRRMTNDNLLAVEIKKSTNQEHSFKDQAKLAAFREQLGYQHSLFIRFLTGVDDVGFVELDWK
ncbi:hypothetical protein [Celerinatantimonas diazotrophica]|uniref:PD-(D/E)XK nuclease superfamily protein n=1 Tax=Celerinatantimonas diazotrophica TaxID=412034 RepID=A0A4R1JAJ6_9GAMM|nr:hypothetical protein [Celerinatantimonas diazotrophica]TCK47560.1 hypothetical protein EV690_2595 [Celerinatantimonas diazotrophica]CAG9296819.1 hypothetical protein CEDIAZO_01977 [Celerinatantimonas diazotrophica]